MKSILTAVVLLLLVGCGGSSTWNALNQKTGSSKEITSFSILSPARVGFIDETSKVISVAVPYGTAVTSLAAKFSTTGDGITVGEVAQVSGVTLNDFTTPLVYSVKALDGSAAQYTVSVYVAGIDEKDIIAFSISGRYAAIVNTSISLVLPYGTSLSSLSPEISFTGVSISPSSGAAQNFTGPVTYTVTAYDGSTKSYTVNAVAASIDSKDIISFTILGVNGTISGTSVSIVLPYGTDLSAQIATLMITGSSVNPPSGYVQNFSTPVQYTVTAADGSTRVYTVTAGVAMSSSKDITSFVVEGVNCSISGTDITAKLMSTSNLRALYPVISYNGVSIFPASGAKTNFNSPVVYTVTAADGTTKAYTVSITQYSAPTGISLSPGAAYFTTGGSTDVTASVIPSTAYQQVSWGNVTPLVVSVAASGGTATITGLAGGLGLVKVTTIDGGLVVTCLAAVESDSEIVSSVTGSGIGQKTTLTMTTGNTFADIQTTPDTIGSAISFPTGSSDGGTGTIATPFIIAETEVTYRMWGTVYAWAVNNGYSFGNGGICGSTGSGNMDQPVTTITWRDAMVWCNALTEYYNAKDNIAVTDLTPVYYSDSAYATPIRTATAVTAYYGGTSGSQDCPYIRDGGSGNTSMTGCTATGFRLPTGDEWEYSARYIGTSLPANANYALVGGNYYTNGASAAGALNVASVQSATTVVSVYSVNSGGTTAQAGLKNASTLGLLDMSGNVQEFCFDWSNQSMHNRFVYGGSYTQTYAGITVSSNTGFVCYGTTAGTGFRPARNR